jgi:hypothetical protein
VAVLREQRPKTEEQIVKAIYRRARVTTDAHSVRTVLVSHTGRFSRIRPRFQLFRRSIRWRLVEAGPARDPGDAARRSLLGLTGPRCQVRLPLRSTFAVTSRRPTRLVAYSTTGRGATGSGSSTMSSAVAWLIQY